MHRDVTLVAIRSSNKLKYLKLEESKLKTAKEVVSKFLLQIYVELTSYTLIPAIKNCAQMAFLELSTGASGSHLNMIHV